MMNYLYLINRILLFVFVIHASLAVQAQSTPIDFDKAYGLDPVLYNGKIYSYFLPPGTGGTQFLYGPDYMKGSAIIRGISYEELILNYDVFNQQLILEYYPEESVRKQIVISDAWLEEFNLDHSHFEMLAISDTIREIYQVIENETYRVLYSWRKDLPLDSKHGATNHVFSDPIKESFLSNGSIVLKYSSNKSFVALFDPDDQAILKKHLRQKKLNLKKASDNSIVELLEYCKTFSLQ